ncbi:hypothetical protein [Chengkuizengella marina]|uniref:Uncharacterized protein n=1 Tax=Chengkuizengella marina TaxID=2507566 RepID=A0A6N9Q7N2_9BACL|nr:hypothetical protein [Chengkuizengella marina]NBI30780.1 hypothetical protein [Chengkuizengella marina]
MIKSKVIKDFRDKYSTSIYKKGDMFTSDKKERIEELQKLGYLSKEEKLTEKEQFEGPKHVGGGNYELPNGEKVKGKEKAFARLKELTKKND